MKVLVNGATGLVGFAVVEAFLEAGHEVRASDRPGSDFTELAGKGLEIVPAELDDQDALGRTVAGMEIVVHVAGLFDLGARADLLDKVNHRGTRNICEAVLKHAPNLTRFVQVASVGVYGNPVRCPCREDDPKRPRNAYERTKSLGEQAAFEYHQKHGLPVASVRPTLIYGPRARYGHAMFIAAMSLLKAEIWDWFIGLRSGPLSSHVHIDDVAQGILLVATREEAVGKAFNIADPNPVDGVTFIKSLTDPLGLKFKQWIPYFGSLMAATGGLVSILPAAPFNAINWFLGRRWNKLVEQEGLEPALTLRMDRDWIGYMTGSNYYDVSRLKELGMTWKWPDFTAGIRETIAWYKEHKWIP